LKLYTKTGDGGETSLIYGSRIGKDDIRVESYGTVDEANSVIGVAVSVLGEHPDMVDLIKDFQRVQRDLFDVGRDLATPLDKIGEHFVTESHVTQLESVIDRLEEETLPLRQFILPGGAVAAAHLHHARTVTRRAERLCVALLRREPLNPYVRVYLNRLSDLLFAAARAVNQRLSVSEPVVDFSAPAKVNE